MRWGTAAVGPGTGHDRESRCPGVGGKAPRENAAGRVTAASTRRWSPDPDVAAVGQALLPNRSRSG